MYQQSIKKKSQSLPRLTKAEFQAKSQSLTKLFHHEAEISIKNEKQNTQCHEIPDPQLKNRQKINKILLRSKSMVEFQLNQIQKNKDKIQVAKRFRVMNKKSSGPFLTGVDIYKEQQQDYTKHKSYDKEIETKENITDYEQNLKQLLSQKYDDLSELRKMIRKTSKNLGVYKQQVIFKDKQDNEYKEEYTFYG